MYARRSPVRDGLTMCGRLGGRSGYRRTLGEGWGSVGVGRLVSVDVIGLRDFAGGVKGFCSGGPNSKGVNFTYLTKNR